MYNLNTDDYYMNLALTEAELAYKNGDVPIGCVIVFNKLDNININKNNKNAIDEVIKRINTIDSLNDIVILSKSYNRRYIDKDATKHAEIIAISEACNKLNDFRLDGCTMYVTLEPCQMCAGAIIQSRIKKLVIATKSLKSGSCGSIINILNNDNFNHKVDIRYGILKNESENLLKKYFKELRNDKYN